MPGPVDASRTQTVRRDRIAATWHGGAEAAFGHALTLRRYGGALLCPPSSARRSRGRRARLVTRRLARFPPMCGCRERHVHVRRILIRAGPIVGLGDRQVVLGQSLDVESEQARHFAL